MTKRHTKKMGQSSGLKGMKLIAIKEECYALSGAATTAQLKQKYPTLCRKRDFRQRSTWEYVLKELRANGDWSGIRISEIEQLAEKECTSAQMKHPGHLVFSPERVEMDRAAENDD